MNIVDANIILRYLLNDAEEMSEKASNLLENNEIFVPNEVIAEVVYVFEKVYEVERGEICSSLTELFGYNNIQVSDGEVVKEALKVYSKEKLDFVDAVLYAYNRIRKHKVYTFDKRLNNLLGNKDYS